MYQIRITDPDGTNPIVLERADNISYNKVINTLTESINFDLPTSDPKAAYINETKIWEFWDTVANERLNRGPIHSIDDSDSGILKISGPGRSQFLSDHIKTSLVAFYKEPHLLMDSLRFENLAAAPSTKTYVWNGDDTKKDIFFPASVTVNKEQYMQYYGLSKQTKDNATDDNTGEFKVGVDSPSKNPYEPTDSFWAGTDKKDSLIIDLGDAYTIDHVRLLFPWWGGNQRINSRSYDWKLYYSTYSGPFEGLTSGTWTEIFSSVNERIVTRGDSGGFKIIFDTGIDPDGRTDYLGYTLPPIQYFRVVITDVHAYAANVFVLGSTQEYYEWQCNPDTSDIEFGDPGLMVGKKINDRTTEPANDCYAGIVEFGAYQKIIDVNEITNLVKQRIKSDNKQIDYYHTANASETITTDVYRRYEPGTFFKRAEISYSGANTSYTKFYQRDCSNCYAAFNFGIMDDFNSLIFHSTSSSQSNVDVYVPRYASSITMKGASNAVVNNIDAWLGVVDPLSWGGQYAYSKTTNDTAILHFRGESLQWWATIPATETGATVELQLRSKSNVTNNWSSWSTLESGFVLSNDITSELVYEIPLNTILAADTIYEFKIKNLNGGYVSVDSFGGWWTGSAVDYNDDSDSAELKYYSDWKQIYDSRFTNGTMAKTNRGSNWFTFNFHGDRAQVYSAKGRNHGKLSIVMTFNADLTSEFSPLSAYRVMIPGGDPSNGYRTFNLDTGKKGAETPGLLIFDTRDYTGWKFGPSGTSMDTLPWGYYSVRIELHETDTYLSNFDAEDSDQFVERCSDCTPESDGTNLINKFIYVDSFGVHSAAVISGAWKLQKNSEVLSSIAEALELEWDIGEQGLTVLPRIGEDTDVILMEGVNTVISSQVVKDGSKMASQLFSSGADIEGLPLFTITEDRQNRIVLGRTVQQLQDYRDLADYFTLVGVSRAELVRRREPEYRINVSHVGYKYGLNAGDSFIIKKKALDPIRVRGTSLTITQSKSSGIVYSLECDKWPPIV